MWSTKQTLRCRMKISFSQSTNFEKFNYRCLEKPKNQQTGEAIRFCLLEYWLRNFSRSHYCYNNIFTPTLLSVSLSSSSPFRRWHLYHRLESVSTAHPPHSTVSCLAYSYLCLAPNLLLPPNFTFLYAFRTLGIPFASLQPTLWRPILYRFASLSTSTHPIELLA